MKKVIAAFASVLMLASVLVAVQLAGPTSSQERADALSGSSFQAGNIISDANFYDGDSMSASQVQSFLNGQVGSCTNSGCLRNGRYSLNSHGADAMCGALTGGSSLSAADIITRVGRACSISPKVILVTLQKEQALVTSRGPSAAVLERAMGYACPDNAQGRCDPAYAGVGNQVYWAAWQWKRYGNPSGTSNYFTWFAPGGTRQIQYNVPTSCGTRGVAVQNKATAALYYYTPYTPNTAALNNLYGTGDGCSAYGNRNFWRMYSDWFGSPTASAKPIGALDAVVGGGDVVTVRGWTIDPTAPGSSSSVHVYVDSAAKKVVANQTRSDVGRAHPGAGSAHGYSADVPAAPGSHKVCVYAVSVDGARNTTLGCRTVTVVSASPFGRVDSAQAVPGGIRVRGWAIDADQQKPAISVRVVAGGKTTTLRADKVRSDVGRVYPAAGSGHGFDAVVPGVDGTQDVTVTGVNTGKGIDKQLAATASVRVPAARPDGGLDTFTGTATGITVSGWAIDGKTTNPIDVHVYIDGAGRRLVANQTRTDIGRIFPAYGSAHGFSLTATAAPGPHQVCVYGIDSAGGSNPTFRCDTVQVGNAPRGGLDAVTATSGGVAVRGWAWDADTTAVVPVDVYVDGRGARLQANGLRADVAKAYPAAGRNRGFSGTVAAASGKHDVCVYAIDANGGANTTLGCRTVTVP